MTRDELERALAERLEASIRSDADARQRRPDVVCGYLFGSFAEDRSHTDSDIDVAVLLDRARFPTARDRFERRLALSADLARGLGRTVDLVILNDVPPGLARAIVTRGRRIFCSEPEADHVFVRDTLLRAADLDPFLARMRRIKLDAMSRPSPERDSGT